VAVLWDAFSADQLPVAEAAARGIGAQLQLIKLRHPPYDYASALSTAAAGRVDAVLPLMSPVFFRERVSLLEWLDTHRLPAIFGQREFVEAGGLITYGANITDLKRRIACGSYPERK